jgi:hypothetical protein
MIVRCSFTVSRNPGEAEMLQTFLDPRQASLLSSMTAKAYGSSLAFGTFCGGTEMFKSSWGTSPSSDGVIISTGNVRASLFIPRRRFNAPAACNSLLG